MTALRAPRRALTKLDRLLRLLPRRGRCPICGEPGGAPICPACATDLGAELLAFGSRQEDQ